MLDRNLPLIQAHQPLTFLERGVAVPFTTPALAGARVRTGKSRIVEFILSNPSGGRGVYVVQWSGLQRFCHPTVHDVLLQDRIATLPSFSPAGIRLAARDIAARGYAGQNTRQAAKAAGAHDQAATEQASHLLLALLTEQIQPGSASISRTALSPQKLESLGRQAIFQAAPVLGCPVDAISRGLTALARSFTSLGVEDTGEMARLPGLLSRMIHLRDDLFAWTDDGMRTTGLAADMAKAAQITISCGEILMREIRGLSTNMLALLRAWLAVPADTTRRLERLDWLLDGWELPCLLWETASQASHRRAALLEMAQLVPTLPPEIQDWMGRPLAPTALHTAWQGPPAGDGSRSGSAVFAMVARNERLRALSVRKP